MSKTNFINKVFLIKKHRCLIAAVLFVMQRGKI
nr:MAG TPA: hypothetical protein [Caudoviricetes sp.]